LRRAIIRRTWGVGNAPRVRDRYGEA